MSTTARPNGRFRDDLLTALITCTVSFGVVMALFVGIPMLADTIARAAGV